MQRVQRRGEVKMKECSIRKRPSSSSMRGRGKRQESRDEVFQSERGPQREARVVLFVCLICLKIKESATREAPKERAYRVLRGANECKERDESLFRERGVLLFILYYSYLMVCPVQRREREQREVLSWKSKRYEKEPLSLQQRERGNLFKRDPRDMFIWVPEKTRKENEEWEPDLMSRCPREARWGEKSAENPERGVQKEEKVPTSNVR